MRSARLLVIAGAVVATIAPAVPAGASVTALSGVTPGVVDAPTTPWTTLDLTGAGLSAGDVVTTVPASPSVVFSSSVDDGAGGIKVNLQVSNATYGTFDVVATDPSDGSTATCAGCLHLGHAPYTTTMSRVDPAATSLDLQWYTLSPGSAAIDHYRVAWSDADGPIGEIDVATGTATINNLTAGIDYTVSVSAVSSWGEGPATTFVERIGAAPDQPAITGYTPGLFSARFDVLNGDTWTLSHELTWDVRGTTPDGSPFEDDLGDSVAELINARDRGTYTVSVRVHNSFGASPWSAPAQVHVIAVPAPPRRRAASVLGSPVRLSWQPPLDDGGSPVTGYVVHVATDDGRRDVFRDVHTTSTSVVLSHLPAGREWVWWVWARNVATDNSSDADFAYGASFTTGTVGVVGTTRDGHARWLAPNTTTWQRLPGARFESAPSPLHTRGRTYFVGATSKGTVFIRTARSSWHRLVSPTCLRASAAVARDHRLWVVCRGADGTLMQLSARLLVHGLPKRLAPLGFVREPSIVGDPTIARDRYGDAWVVYRTLKSDSRGHNVRFLLAGTDSVSHVALACTSRPMVAATAGTTYDGYDHLAIACRQDRHHVAWARVGFPDNARSHGVATLPFAIGRHIAVTYPAARLQLIVRSRRGLRRYDVRSHTWLWLGGPAGDGLSAVTWPL